MRISGQTGVFVGKINPNKAHSAFSGYADKKASEKKIIRDVFVKGDSAFNSGTCFYFIFLNLEF